LASFECIQLLLVFSNCHPSAAGVVRAGSITVTTRRRLHDLSPSPSEVPVPTTIGFNHVATLTSDVDRLVDFYATVFGAAVTAEMEAEPDHPRMVILDLGGGAALNVFEAPADEIIGERRRPGRRGPIDHYGLAVDSLATLETVKERLVAAGADIGEIQQLGTIWSLFFRDPDGMELEVCCAAG
jgi:catechol 2,3-dioxygenase-like lactoylglutathione lyase family enzyme